jgi:hypothetical protein
MFHIEWKCDDIVGTKSRKGCFRTERDYEKKNGIP